MTKKEIEKFLADTKVYVNGKSKEIQEKLFSFGYKWGEINSTEVSDVNEPFLLIYKKGYITHTNDMCCFAEHDNREISAEEILSLEITEPSYRPFKNKDECWCEMQKHHPFGWFYSKSRDSYVPLKVEIENATNFVALFNHYHFADGTPFGILEN